MAKKLILSGFMSSLLLLSVIAYSLPAFAQGSDSNGKPEVVGISGIVPGKNLIVHVLVVVNPDEDRNQKALAALAQQGARPFTPNEFSTISLKWDQFSDGNPGNDFVEQYYNPKNTPNGVDRTAFTNTHTTWNSVSTSNFSFVDAGNTGRCPSLVQECRGPQTFDGNNDVAWMKLNSPSTLGVTWTGTSTDEADMALNTSFDWNNGWDAETVFLHENGHALGLGHSETTDAIMYAYYQGQDRILHQDDIDGISSLYPASPQPVNPTLPLISIDDVSSLEGDVDTTDFIFTVSRDNDSEVSTVDYEVLYGTADSEDLIFAQGQVNFQIGDTSKSITIQVNGDTVAEPEETFEIQLSNCQNCDFSDSIGTGTILDDDGAAIVQITFGQYNGKRDVLSVRASSTDFNDVLTLHVKYSSEDPWSYVGLMDSKGDGTFSGKYDITNSPLQIKVEGNSSFDIGTFS